MKLSPTVTLALALSAGIAAAAVAQTSPTPGTPTTPGTQSTYPQAAAPVGQTGSTYGQATPNYGATRQANPNPTTQSSLGQPNSNDQVKGAQQQLHAAGLYNGPMDGLMDPDTMAAIARFQQQRGLKQTSQLDQPTLNALMGNRTTGSGSGQGAPTAPMGAGGATTGAPAR